MKQIKKFVPVLLAVLVIAAVFVIPAFAQEINPPPTVAPPVFDWSEISQALSTLVSALLLPVIGFFARWLFAQGNYQKSLLSKENQYALDLAIKTFVYAAEQMKLKGFIEDKLDYVINLCEAWLAKRKLTMDLNELRARVEAIVAENFSKTEAAG